MTQWHGGHTLFRGAQEYGKDMLYAPFWREEEYIHVVQTPQEKAAHMLMQCFKDDAEG